MSQSIHVLASIWIGIAKITTCSWIEQGHRPENPHCSNGTPVDINDDVTVYITAIYWVITSLTTVGYGDYKGYTPVEYSYQMVVEFLGIGVFSWLMGSINGLAKSDSKLQDIIDKRMEDVESWLRKLDKSRTKNFNQILYNNIKAYSEKSYMHDYSNIKENEFYS